MLDSSTAFEYLEYLAKEDNDEFFLPQIEGARRIIQAFTTGNSTLLLAHMQSGKSGTFILASIIMIHIGAVKQVVLFTGISLRELYDQLKKDIVTKCKMYETIFGLKHNEVYNKMMVLSNSQKASIILEDNIMVVWDESHYAQDTGNMPFKMFNRSGYGIDDETLDTWTKRNSYLLDVSATPFAEYLNIKHTNTPKQIVRLDTTKDYRGVEYFLNNSCIRESFDIECEPGRFVDDILSNIDFDNPMYYLFRINNQEEVIGVIETLFPNGEVEICYMDQQHRQLQWEHLKQQPTKPTFIYLKNKGRIGQVVPKKYVALTYEYSKAGGNTDTIAQSLLGRMCGYVSTDQHNPVIYIPPKFLDKPDIDTDIASIYETRKAIIDILEDEDDKKRVEIARLEKEHAIMTQHMSMNELEKYVAFMKEGKVLPIHGKNIASIKLSLDHHTPVYTITDTKSYSEDQKLEEMINKIGTPDLDTYEHMGPALQDILDDIMLNEDAFGNKVQRAEVIFRLRDIISSKNYNRIHFEDIGFYEAVINRQSVDIMASAIKHNMPYYGITDKEISIYVCNHRIFNEATQDYDNAIGVLPDYTENYQIYICAKTICSSSNLDNVITTGKEAFTSVNNQRSTILCVCADACREEVDKLMCAQYVNGTILNLTIPVEQDWLISLIERARKVFSGPYTISKRRGRVSSAEKEMCNSSKIFRYCLKFNGDGSIL